MTLTSHEAAAANMGQDLKDLYLQDLSDGMLLEIETKCFQSGRENQSVKLIFMLWKTLWNLKLFPGQKTEIF